MASITEGANSLPPCGAGKEWSFAKVGAFPTRLSLPGRASGAVTESAIGLTRQFQKDIGRTLRRTLMMESLR
jgi:hypothetical protein